MTAADLRAEAERRIAWYQEHGLTCEPTMTLVLTRVARGDTIRLFGRQGGPIGEVLCVNSAGHTVAAFPCQKVLNALDGLKWGAK